jgi:hypothetical protein
MKYSRQPAPPIPATIIALFVLIAIGLITASIVLVFSASDRFESGIRIQQLREAFHSVAPYPGSRMTFTDESRSDNCGLALYFEVFAATTDADTIRTYYTRQFQSRGWVQDPRTSSTYIAEAIRVDVIIPAPQAVGGVQIPAGVLAARSPNGTIYVVVVTGWRADLCPELNRASVLNN